MREIGTPGGNESDMPRKFSRVLRPAGWVETRLQGPFLELFARGPRAGWDVWGNQASDYYPTWATYANHSQVDRPQC